MTDWQMWPEPGSPIPPAVIVYKGRRVGTLDIGGDAYQDLAGRLSMDLDGPGSSAQPWQVVVDPTDLRTVLDQRIGHSHLVSGVWDPDNRPGLAGTRCEECAARDRLRGALAAWDGRQEGAKP